jgi:anti-sigma regulatory factor (Ser/Thr protein kinase)
VISIYDWGAGSAAPSTTPGLGLGLPIMQRLCDRVSLSRIEGATRLELRFGRQA